jgi:hypothetical protein
VAENFCNAPTVVTASTIADISYEIGAAQLSIPFTGFTANPTSCEAHLLYVVSFDDNAISTYVSGYTAGATELTVLVASG